MPGLSTIAPALPVATTLLGLTSLATGAMTALSSSPIDAMRSFGLRPTPQNTARDTGPFTKALVYTYASRNIGGALTTLGLTAFWQMQYSGSVAATTAKSCLGLSMLLGTVVAVGDAMLVRGYAESVEGDLSKAARKASVGHAVAAVIIAVIGGTLLWT